MWSPVAEGFCRGAEDARRRRMPGERLGGERQGIHDIIVDDEALPASAIAGAIRSAKENLPEPYLRQASSRPATVPGTPIARPQ